jgi:hypothetical protein
VAFRHQRPAVRARRTKHDGARRYRLVLLPSRVAMPRSRYPFGSPRTSSQSCQQTGVSSQRAQVRRATRDHFEAAAAARTSSLCLDGLTAVQTLMILPDGSIPTRARRRPRRGARRHNSTISAPSRSPSELTPTACGRSMSETPAGAISLSNGRRRTVILTPSRRGGAQPHFSAELRWPLGHSHLCGDTGDTRRHRGVFRDSLVS